MKRLSSQVQILIGAGVIVLILLVFFFIAWRPQASRLSQLAQEKQQEEKKYKEAETTLARLKAAKKEAPEIEAKLVVLSKRMPEEPELPSLLVELQDVANKAGIDFVSIKPSAPVTKETKDKKKYSEIPLSISLTGSFFDVVDYLYRLEKMPREIKIQTTGVATTLDAYPELAVELSGFTFVLGEAKTPPAGAQAPTGGGTSGTSVAPSSGAR